jgi:hypothetical protein
MILRLQAARGSKGEGLMGKVHLIKAGTRITCLRGHIICKVVVDIRVNDTLQPAMFAHWRVLEPKLDEAFPVCRCGAVRETAAGIQLHTINGWR